MLAVGLVAGGLALAYMAGSGPANTVEVQSTIDGHTYRVQNLPDKQDAADKIAEIRAKLINFMDWYKADPSAMADPRVKVMVERFNPETFIENDIHASTTSYSENKGEKIVVCIRDKRAPYPFADENTVMFVLLHEMAHLMTTTVGHTPEFWANFKRILHDAVQCGLYSPVNYTHSPTDYCGMTITDSPI